MKYTIGYLLFLCFTVVTIGCGRMDVSDSNHTIGGEATVKIVIGVDVTACEALPPEDKLECVASLIELAKLLTEQGAQPEGFGGI
jgi:hypothetical protein